MLHFCSQVLNKIDLISTVDAVILFLLEQFAIYCLLHCQQMGTKNALVYFENNLIHVYLWKYLSSDPTNHLGFFCFVLFFSFFSWVLSDRKEVYLGDDNSLTLTFNARNEGEGGAYEADLYVVLPPEADYIGIARNNEVNRNNQTDTMILGLL